MSFNPNANANSFTPGGPPFRPGQPYVPPTTNPYAQQQPNQGQGQYYDQYQQYQGQSQQAYGASPARELPS